MRDRTGGFILVSSLASLALLALLVTGAAMLVRSAAADAGLVRARLTRDALAQAGLEIAAYQLFMLKRSPEEVTDQRVRLDAGVVTLSVVAESGKVDLNGAGAPILAALWRRTGSGGMTPEAFAARVLDWRDSDDKPGASGAERGEYQSAGRPGPRNGLFETVDELQNVLGVGPREVLALKPLLTVHNPEGKLSVLTASREALLLLPRVDAAVADRALRIRRSGGPAAGEQIAALFTAAADAVDSKVGAAFEVRVRIEGGPAAGGRIYIVTQAVEPTSLYYVTDVRSSP